MATSTITDVAVALLLFSVTLAILFYPLKLGEDLKGPSSPSYTLGYEHELKYGDVLGMFHKWSKEYGTAFTLPGCFGEKILVISDPRAIHHVLHEAYDYPKTGYQKKVIEMTFGKEVVLDKDEDHKRHRKVLNPAFSSTHIRRFLPLYRRHVDNLIEQFRIELEGKSRTMDLIPWLHRVALDIIGEGAFSYQFDAVQNKPNELTTTLHELEGAGIKITPKATLIMALIRYIPSIAVSFQSKYFPTGQQQLANRYLRASQQKGRDFLTGVESRTSGRHSEESILSVLVRANNEEDVKKRLNEKEVLAQISALISAGHHSTGHTLSWILYELANHPEDQSKIYEEISAIRNKNPTGEFTSSDYDSMNHLMCVIKESLRLRPVLPAMEREAMKDDMLFLDFPVATKSGKIVNKINVKTGQIVKVDIAGYNRLESIWGEDSNEWNPKRYDRSNLIPDVTSVGLVANILTFSGGPRGCAGWRFALAEIQTVIVGLIERFEFLLPPNQEICGVTPFFLLIPTIKGREKEGPQLPLVVKERGL